MGGIERKIQADHVLHAPLGQHLKEKAAAASHIEHESRFLRFAQSAFDKVEMIAENEAAVNLLQASGRVGVGRVPILRRIVVMQFQRMRLRIQADQAAIAAFDNAEDFVRRAVKAVRGGEQHPRFTLAAGRAWIRSRDSRVSDGWSGPWWIGNGGGRFRRRLRHFRRWLIDDHGDVGFGNSRLIDGSGGFQNHHGRRWFRLGRHFDFRGRDAVLMEGVFGAVDEFLGRGDRTPSLPRYAVAVRARLRGRCAPFARCRVAIR